MTRFTLGRNENEAKRITAYIEWQCTKDNEKVTFLEQVMTETVYADSDETGHLFRSMSDSGPMKPDSNRSEATLRVFDKGVSGLSQGFHV